MHLQRIREPDKVEFAEDYILVRRCRIRHQQQVPNSVHLYLPMDVAFWLHLYQRSRKDRIAYIGSTELRGNCVSLLEFKGLLCKSVILSFYLSLFSVFV